MRKLIVLLLFTISGVCANATNGHDEEARENIRIKELYQSEGTVDRSINVYTNAAIIQAITTLIMKHLQMVRIVRETIVYTKV